MSIHSCHPQKDTRHSRLDPLPNVGTFGANTNVGTIYNIWNYYRTQKRSTQAGSTKRTLEEEEPALPVMDNPPLLLTTRTTPTLKATIFEKFGTTRRTTMHHQFACTYMTIESDLDCFIVGLYVSLGTTIHQQFACTASDRLLHSRTIYTLYPGLLYHK